MSEYPSATGLVQGKPLTLKVVGVGSAGLTILEQMARTDLSEFALCAVHCNARVLESSACQERILLGSKRLRGIGTGGDPELGKIVAEDELPRLKTLFTGVDLALVVSGLGGGSGSGIAPILCRIARESGALVIALVTLPFEFEGMRRNRQAVHGLQLLKAAADVVVFLPNEKVRYLIDETESIQKGFEITRSMLVETARAITQMLTRPALIHIDFSYLYSVLRKRQSESCVSVVEATGENRADSVITQLMSSPWLDRGQALRDADSVLVTLVGGPDLSLAEVNSIMDWLNRTVEKPQLIMGAAIHPEYSGKIRATIIASRHNCMLGSDEPEPAGVSKVEPRGELAGIESAFLSPAEVVRPTARFVAPPPELPQEKAEELLAKQSGRRSRPPRFRQQQLPLEIVSKGRFEKSHPTIYHGEDLDVPTYVRRGIPLN